MSSSINSRVSLSKARQGQRFGWLIKLAQAMVIVLGIYSGYSMAISHREAVNATETVKPVMQETARPARMASACEHNPIERLASR